MTKQKELQKKKTYIQKIKLFAVREDAGDKRLKLTSPEDIAKLKLIKDELLNCDREKFLCLHMDTRNRIISYEVVAIGTLNQALLHPREVFKGAILSNANSVIVLHNHPSSELEPSKQDIAFTKRLKSVGQMLGIEVIEHMIFGDKEKYFSFSEKGLL